MTSPLPETIKTLKKILHDKQALQPDLRWQPLTQTLIYGVVRYWPRLEAILQQLLNKPLSKKESDIHFLLLTGLFQLIYLQQPAYAVVNETVHATSLLKKAWAKKLVNAILRNFLRHQTEYLAKADQSESAQFSHPQWLIEKIRHAWPHHWQELLLANQQHPPLTLRVNLQRAKREDYLPGEFHPYNLCGITLAQAQKTSTLAGFAEGYVSVQDAAAQLAAALLDLQPHLHVLDACAAPGNKSAHLLETEPSLQLTALDIDATRLQHMQQEFKRLQLHAKLLCADAAKLNDWWHQQLFDRILLDAPCSATGVIRRHPDIKYLRQPADIMALTKKQQHLLNTLWQTLKPGGKLLYATCSILPEENQGIINDFLKQHADATEIPLIEKWGMPQAHGRQILPGMDNMDGFYYCLLAKKIANA